ncbi:MAG: hypothetical protein IJB96_00915 [Lachnospira sp.]|nr:hypothetical protein [Lachnospira sp.]
MANYLNTDYSALFSSLGTSNNNNSFFGGIDLNTYSSIRNGSYRKLLNAYYDKENNNSTATTVDGETQTVAQQKVNATSVRDEAESLNDAVDALNKNSLWEKKDVKGEDGNTTKDYDKDAIYKAVSSFVKSYNSLVEGTGNSSDESVLKSAANMVNYTKANKDLLARIGVSIGSDNKLTVDEDVFKKSDMVTAKSVFAGAGSYGKSVAGNASMIYGQSASQLAKLNTANMYGSDGSYSYIPGSTYNSFL